MAEKDKMDADMEEAIEKVSAELEQKKEPIETVEETPVEKTQKEPKDEESPSAFVPDDALIERAIKAGLSMKDAKGFTSAEFAEAILSRLEEASKPKEAKEEKKTEDDDSPIKDFDEMLAKMESDGEYNEDFVKMFKGMTSLLKKQNEEIKSLRAGNKSASEQSFFEKQISTLGDGVVKHLDAAHKSKLESKFKVLKKAYSDDPKMTDEEIFKDAAKLAIGDILEKAAAEGKTAKAEERRKLTIARPGGEQGLKGGKAKSIDEIVAEVAAEMSV